MAPGGPEILLIVGIAILIFGAQKIPKLARSIGESTGEFKKGQAKVEQELEEIRPDTDLSADVNPDAGAAVDTETNS
ncbi:Sec-independent protein translocase TatA [Natronolimnobius baerhuensis]|uniref:Sec-independent protein translocase TatA n=1 Tax=Natronolimnobius baerhuensis TaxID=253108 RepID=A0A202EBA3_9EURY|nr:Sec-independent protein translocase TatA [Natronolimnobius baerhuensis]